MGPPFFDADLHVGGPRNPGAATAIGIIYYSYSYFGRHTVLMITGVSAARLGPAFVLLPRTPSFGGSSQHERLATEMAGGGARCSGKRRCWR